MRISQISKPVTAASLNESLASKFGQKIKLENFTLEQLQDARNKIRTKVFSVETHESYDAVQSETYQKSKLFLDVLNAEITERSHIAEAKDAHCSDDCCGTDTLAEDCTCAPSCKSCNCNSTNESAKPDFPDLDGDGDKKEPMKKAAKDAKKSNKPKKGVKPSFKKGVNPFEKKVDEGKAIIETYFASVLKEGAEDHAELVMAAKDMVDRVTGWMEDTAEMQTESMLELADAIRDEMGSEKSEAFTMALKPALEAMYGVMETTRVSLTTGVGMLTGEADEAPMMGADDELGMEPEMGMEPPVDGDIDDLGMDDLPDDEFGASGAADGGVEDAGRAKRESKVNRKKKVSENSRKLSNILSKKK
jgi:hypothetical protein|tara:strand:- start:964 stop:2049 length:1086 start_codon:yes stop_codon:yes gene_type:complete